MMGDAVGVLRSNVKADCGVVGKGLCRDGLCVPQNMLRDRNDGFGEGVEGGLTGIAACSAFSLAASAERAIASMQPKSGSSSSSAVLRLLRRASVAFHDRRAVGDDDDDVPLDEVDEARVMMEPDRSLGVKGESYACAQGTCH